MKEHDHDRDWTSDASTGGLMHSPLRMLSKALAKSRKTISVLLSESVVPVIFSRYVNRLVKHDWP